MAEYNDSLAVTEVPTSNYLPHPHHPLQYILLSATLVSAVTGVVGNSLLAIIYARDTSSRSTTNTYMLSIAVADLLVAITCSGIRFVQEVGGTWPFNGVSCKLFQACMELSTFASVLTLTAFSVDRYYAIIHPLKKYVSGRKSAVRISCLVWTASFLLSVPKFAHSGVRLRLQPGLQGYTMVSHCAVYQNHTPLARYYSLADFSLFFALPLSVICVMYAAASRRLLQTASNIAAISSINVTQLRQARVRKKAAKMVIVLSVIFFVGFLPHNVLMLRIFFLEGTDSYWNSAASFAYCYGHHHFWLNPIALYFYNDFVKSHLDYYLTFGINVKSKC